jgi:hypothetical protein
MIELRHDEGRADSDVNAKGRASRLGVSLRSLALRILLGATESLATEVWKSGSATWICCCVGATRSGERSEGPQGKQFSRSENIACSKPAALRVPQQSE